MARIPSVKSTEVPATPGQVYRLTAWLRADRPNTRVEIGLQAYRSNLYSWQSVKTVSVGTEWAQHELIARFPTQPPEMKSLYVRVRLPDGDGAVCVDDVELHAAEPLDEWAAWQSLGMDRHSLIADPLFVHADKDDYRLKPDSPAFKLGFQRIPVETDRLLSRRLPRKLAPCCERGDTMTRHLVALQVALLLAPLAALQAADSQPARPIADTSATKPVAKPNIIVILADDLGWGDVGCYGATKIKTPHIDRLASEGMKFTDAHTAASLCSPSRYGLMTGRYPWRLHLKGNDYRLEPGRLTMASMLKTQGYRSAAIGKWHLGYSADWNQLPITGPLEVGFDYHFGVPQNHNDPYRAFIENHDIVGRKPGEAFRVVKGHDFPEGLAQPRVDDQVSETLVTKALRFIEENRERPFFLYFTSVVPHTHITPAARFRGTSQAGLYGDYIQELDDNVGRILETLDRLQLAGRTLVFFSSDNGGTPEDFKGTQNTKLNLASEAGGVREKARTAKADARALGHITNGPWHDGKGSPYEGGHRVPFIARWPGRIPPGTTSDHLLCLTDLLATAAEIVEATLPEKAGEDSFSFLPVLLGRPSTAAQRKTAFIQGDQNDNAIAVRSGPWKLIESTNSKKQKVHQLYDLTSDPGETNDIAKSKPEVVQELAAALQKARTDGRTRN